MDLIGVPESRRYQHAAIGGMPIECAGTASFGVQANAINEIERDIWDPFDFEILGRSKGPTLTRTGVLPEAGTAKRQGPDARQQESNRKQAAHDGYNSIVQRLF
jgi:hypothetical protein